MWDWGIELILAMQQAVNLAGAMNLITFTGSTEFFLLVLPALFWLVNRRLGMQMAFMLFVSIWLGSVLKLAFHGPRPYWIADAIQLLSDPEPTFGMPSIHTLNAVVMWAILAHYLQRAWAWAGAILLALLAGVARIYLGVHFPTDVLVGWLLGLLLVLGWQQWHDEISGWLGRRALFQRALYGGILSILFILGGALAQVIGSTTLNATDGWPTRLALEAEALLAAFALTDIVTVAGVLLGFSMGVTFIAHPQESAQHIPLGQQIGRYFIGVVGVLLLWQGLDLLFTPLAPAISNLGYALRYLRYAIVGLWIFGLAPLLFRRLWGGQGEQIAV